MKINDKDKLMALYIIIVRLMTLWALFLVFIRLNCRNPGFWIQVVEYFRLSKRFDEKSEKMYRRREEEVEKGSGIEIGHVSAIGY